MIFSFKKPYEYGIFLHINFGGAGTQNKVMEIISFQELMILGAKLNTSPWTTFDCPRVRSVIKPTDFLLPQAEVMMVESWVVFHLITTFIIVTWKIVDIQMLLANICVQPI